MKLLPIPTHTPRCVFSILSLRIRKPTALPAFHVDSSNAAPLLSFCLSPACNPLS